MHLWGVKDKFCELDQIISYSKKYFVSQPAMPSNEKLSTWLKVKKTSKEPEYIYIHKKYNKTRRYEGKGRCKYPVMLSLLYYLR